MFKIPNSKILDLEIRYFNLFEIWCLVLRISLCSAQGPLSSVSGLILDHLRRYTPSARSAQTTANRLLTIARKFMP